MVLDQGVQRLTLEFRRVEQLDVDVGHLPAHAFDLPLVGGIPLATRDTPPVDHGRVGRGAIGEARVTLDAEEDE